MNHKWLSKKEKEEIITLYETGNYNYTQISVIYNKHFSTIQKFLKGLGYSIPSASKVHRKYEINENFFDIIDSEEKAYYLGYLFADGYNNTDKNCVGFALMEDDVEVLNNLTALIQPTKPLRFIDYSKMVNRVGFGISRNQYRMSIENIHISNRLAELGCVKAKSHILKFPSLNDIPIGIMHHFIRGYFDGDGCIYNPKTSNKIAWSVVGSKYFILELQKLMIDILNVSKTKIDSRNKEKINEICILVYGGRIQVNKIKNWLYKDATIYLKRKYNKF